jgi:hypothetical protein
VLSNFLIKNSGEPVTPLSVLLCAVRGVLMVKQLKQNGVPDGVSGSPTGTCVAV